MPGPSPSPTPQPGPTPDPPSLQEALYMPLPDIPPNAYQLLSNLCDAVDATNQTFMKARGQINTTTGEVKTAINDISNTSMGEATDALLTFWGDSQTDISHADAPLLQITGANALGGSPNALRAVLDQNKLIFQDGMDALQKILQLRLTWPNPPSMPTDQMLKDWINSVHALGNALGDFNLAMQLMIVAIRPIAWDFPQTSVCATGVIPGQPLPTFPTDAFSKQGQGTGSDDNSTKQKEDQIRNLVGDNDLADLLIFYAEDYHVSLDSVIRLLEDGIPPGQIEAWMAQGLNLDSIATVYEQWVKMADENDWQVDPNQIIDQINTWIQSGVNLDEVAAFINDGVTDPRVAVQLLRAGLTPEEVGYLTQQGVDPGLLLTLAKKFGAKNVAGIVEQDITDLQTDSNGLTRQNAINALNSGPPGTYPQVAGPGGAGGDIQFINAQGNTALTCEVKCLSTSSSFVDELGNSQELPQQLKGMSRPVEVVIQVPAGTNAQSWINAYLRSPDSRNRSIYNGVKFEFATPDGSIIWGPATLP